MTINTSPIYISKKGMQELRKQIKRLEHDLKTAQTHLRSLDKTEGQEERLERAEALAVIETIEAEISDKQFTLSRAKQLPRRRDAIKVMLGSVVDLIDSRGRKVRYMLVDSIEADPSKGRISIKSPLGQSLIGRQIHDIVSWTAGITTNQLKLVSIA